MPVPSQLPDHPRRCLGRSQRTRRRCLKWALVGSKYCSTHGGRRDVPFKSRGKLTVAALYSKYLGPTLKERVEQMLNEPHDEQVALFEELAVARSTACEALRLAQPLFDPDQRSKIDDKTKVMIMNALQTAMNHVKDMVIAAAKIEKEAGDKVSLKVVNLVVMQIVAVVNEKCGAENEDLATAIAKAVDERVRLPLNERVNPSMSVDLRE